MRRKKDYPKFPPFQEIKSCKSANSNNMCNYLSECVYCHGTEEQNVTEM